SLPEIETIPPKPSITGLAYALQNLKFDDISPYLAPDKNTDLLKTLIQKFKILARKTDEYSDVDTYAKYLNLMNPDGDDFQNLKQSLSQYFAIEQQILSAKDSRNVPWLVSIMDQKMFPDNVKILSWNYDYQVELAAAQF